MYILKYIHLYISNVLSFIFANIIVLLFLIVHYISFLNQGTIVIYGMNILKVGLSDIVYSSARSIGQVSKILKAALQYSSFNGNMEVQMYILDVYCSKIYIM